MVVVYHLINHTLPQCTIKVSPSQINCAIYDIIIDFCFCDSDSVINGLAICNCAIDLKKVYEINVSGLTSKATQGVSNRRSNNLHGEYVSSGVSQCGA